MNNLTNTILMKVTNLAQTLNVIIKVVDKLLNGFIPHEDATAETCRTILCSGCFGSRPNRVRYCSRFCCPTIFGRPVPPCYTRPVRIAC